MRLFVGIDPGKSGGIAQVSDTGQFRCWPVPATEHDLWALFNDTKSIGWVENGADDYTLVDEKKIVVAIEQVHAMPGQGVSSTFKFGVSYGTLIMAVAAAGLPFFSVTPAKWQRATNLLSKKGEAKTSHKNRIKARAQALAPYCRVTLKTADAIVLADYCRSVKGNGR